MTRRRKSSMGNDLVQLAMAAPMVVAARMTRMALAGPSPSASDRREMSRMTTEKVEAISESCRATAASITRANIDLSFSLMRAAWAPWTQSSGLTKKAAARYTKATAASADRSLAPVRRRAVANAKRLGSKSRR